MIRGIYCRSRYPGNESIENWGSIYESMYIRDTITAYDQSNCEGCDRLRCTG